ncbi:MAG: OmpA family protein [Parvibaculum sp.]|nr:OmpA family protein [Parvibaculum sp.]
MTDVTKDGIAKTKPHSHRARTASFALMLAFVLAPLTAPTASADPLSPIEDTLNKVTGTAGRTVSGTVDEINRTAATPTRTTTGLGRDLSRPVGILSAPQPASPSARPAPPPPTTRYDERPYGTYEPYAFNAAPGRTLARIYFRPGETTLNGSAMSEIAGFAQGYDDRVGDVEIRGYADRSGGDDAMASDIAIQRALAVRQALLEQGLAAGRMRASGMGNTDTSNAAEDRVDIVFDGY